MANRRNLKKDIEFLVYEVISDCYTYKRLFDGTNENEVDKIIDEVLAMRYELIMRVNHPDGKDNPKLVKAHYKKINEDLITKIDDFFKRLNQLLAKAQSPDEKKPEKKETTKKAPVKKAKKEPEAADKKEDKKE